MNNIYTGIGSRKTPKDVCDWMYNFAVKMRNAGIKLRSGGAIGADSAFERGSGRIKEVYIHKNGYKGKYHNRLNVALDMLTGDKREECYHKAASVHQGWRNCDDWARAMHARNILQIEGVDGPLSDFVVYWTEYDKSFNPKGGTATAVNYGKSLGIPTFNLNVPTQKDELLAFVKEKYDIDVSE